VSGVVFALAKAAFWTSIFLFFGKWLGLSKTFTGEDAAITAGTMFAYAVVLTIAGLLLARLDERRLEWKVEKKAYEFNGASFGGIRLDGSGKAYPVKFGGRLTGWVIDGDLTVEVETPIGKVKRKLLSPVAVWTSERIAEKKTSRRPHRILTSSGGQTS
jgi:hypothetical protein